MILSEMLPLAFGVFNDFLVVPEFSIFEVLSLSLSAISGVTIVAVTGTIYWHFYKNNTRIIEVFGGDLRK